MVLAVTFVSMQPSMGSSTSFNKFCVILFVTLALTSTYSKAQDSTIRPIRHSLHPGGRQSLDGSPPNGGCTSVNDGGDICNLQDGGTSVLVDNTILPLNVNDDNWARDLYTVNRTTSFISIGFDFGTSVGVRRVELVLFNCQSRSLIVRSIEIYVDVATALFPLPNPTSADVRVGLKQLPAQHDDRFCVNLYRVCVPLDLSGVNNHTMTYYIVFPNASGSHRVYLAETIFYTDTNICGPDTLISEPVIPGPVTTTTEGTPETKATTPTETTTQSSNDDSHTSTPMMLTETTTQSSNDDSHTSTPMMLAETTTQSSNGGPHTSTPMILTETTTQSSNDDPHTSTPLMPTETTTQSNNNDSLITTIIIAAAVTVLLLLTAGVTIVVIIIVIWSKRRTKSKQIEIPKDHGTYSHLTQVYARQVENNESTHSNAKSSTVQVASEHSPIAHPEVANDDKLIEQTYSRLSRSQGETRTDQTESSYSHLTHPNTRMNKNLVGNSENTYSHLNIVKDQNELSHNPQSTSRDASYDTVELKPLSGKVERLTYDYIDTGTMIGVTNTSHSTNGTKPSARDTKKEDRDSQEMTESDEKPKRKARKPNSPKRGKEGHADILHDRPLPPQPQGTCSYPGAAVFQNEKPNKSTSASAAESHLT